MKQPRILHVLFLCLALLWLGATGCAQRSGDTRTTAAETPTTLAATAAPAATTATTAATAATTAQQSSAVATHTITDDLGNAVQVPDNPRRILALTKNMMDELYELGVIPIGKVEEYQNRPELNALPSVSNQATPNLEAIYQLKPDLVLANSRQHAQMQEGLKSSGAAVVFVDPNKLSKNPLTDEIVFLGKISNRNAEAQKYVDRLNALCKELQGKLAPAGYKTGLFMMSGDSISVAQSTGVFGALLSSLGIQNIVPEGLPGSEKSTWVSYDAETIISKDPDLILLKTSSNEEQANQKILNGFVQNIAWKNLKAIKNSKVFIIPSKIAPGNLSTEDILKSTAKIIYAAGF